MVSTFYQDWFRADTYFRQDTRFVYRKRVPELIWEMAHELTGSKGIQLVRYRFLPLMTQLTDLMMKADKPPEPPEPKK